MTIEKAAELRAKHLEMIEATISRMAGYSAGIKNYCLTLVTGIVGFSITLKLPSLAITSLVPLLAFWMLDAQYLRLERQFRFLYNGVRGADWTTASDFTMEPDKTANVKLLEIIFSWSTAGFYLTAFLAVALVATFFKVNNG